MALILLNVQITRDLRNLTFSSVYSVERYQNDIFGRRATGEAKRRQGSFP